jgi:hypothetical protein
VLIVLFPVATKQPGGVAKMQTDGHFVIYGKDGTPLWGSHTAGFPNAELTLPNTGIVRIMYGSKYQWAEGPAGRPHWDDK